MKKLNLEIEKYRISEGVMASTSLNGNNGAFLIPREGHGLMVIASDSMGWEHVSISLQDRCPT